MAFTPYIEVLSSPSNARAENSRLAAFAALLRLAIGRTILGVIESTLARIHRTLAANAGVALEPDGDPAGIAFVTTHRIPPFRARFRSGRQGAYDLGLATQRHLSPPPFSPKSGRATAETDSMRCAAPPPMSGGEAVQFRRPRAPRSRGTGPPAFTV